ncbi:MAG TPA: DUF2267 domain-containing protein [Candidatus Saccharimonadales bacterium]|nr:DUF2267 domain-containing protein [Candidatus Saccharimonadales bacterium]
MNYHELIRRIKTAANADDDASQDALELVVENVAAHLTDHTRREFAAALPDELQSAAQMVPTANHIDEDIIEQLMDLEDVDETSARARIRAAWQALCDIFDSREVDDITAELPRHMVAALE